MRKRYRQTARDILAANMRQLQRTREPSAQRAIAEMCGVGEGTIARALAAQGNITLFNIEQIANAYGLEPWQLLSPSGVKRTEPDD